MLWALVWVCGYFEADWQTAGVSGLDFCRPSL